MSPFDQLLLGGAVLGLLGQPLLPALLICLGIALLQLLYEELH